MVLGTVKILGKELEDLNKLAQLRGALERSELPRNEDSNREAIFRRKTQCVEKSAIDFGNGEGRPAILRRYQATDVGEQLRQNIKLLNQVSVEGC